MDNENIKEVRQWLDGKFFVTEGFVSDEQGGRWAMGVAQIIGVALLDGERRWYGEAVTTGIPYLFVRREDRTFFAELDQYRSEAFYVSKDDAETAAAKRRKGREEQEAKRRSEEAAEKAAKESEGLSAA